MRVASTPIVQAREVTRHYPGPPAATALHPTSVAIMPGDRLAVLGPSGSGKSTLLAILGTLDEPTSGEVFVQGTRMTGVSERDRSAVRAETIAFVFQQFHLLPGFDAQENVATGLLYAGIGREERRRRAKEALTAVDLGSRITHRPGQLSGGEQQRVAIARALVRRPKVLFADEPTGALDSSTGRKVIDLLDEATGEDTALVVVTHDHDVAARFARVLTLADGRIHHDSQNGVAR